MNNYRPQQLCPDRRAGRFEIMRIGKRLPHFMKLAMLAIMISLSLCAQNTGSVEGRVTNSVTGEAVGGVKVRFLDRQSYVYETATDSNGFIA
jgi:hypothetical protein